MMKRDELISYIEKVKTIDKAEYQKIAELFKDAVMEDIGEIWEKHKHNILMELEKIKLCTKDSTINSSTAIGYILEEFIIKQLPQEYARFVGSTTIAAADFFWKDKSKIELYVNFKADKGGKSNNAVCAANKLINLYSQNKKPKLMLIFKSVYAINEEKSLINIEEIRSVFLESFLFEYKKKVNKDNRNWSKEFNPASGRLQVPPHQSNASIKNIPTPDEVNKFITEELPKLLKGG